MLTINDEVLLAVDSEDLTLQNNIEDSVEGINLLQEETTPKYVWGKNSIWY